MKKKPDFDVGIDPSVDPKQIEYAQKADTQVCPYKVNIALKQAPLTYTSHSA